MKELKIIGNIGKIEMKYTPQGKAVTEFSVAVNSKEKGEKVTEWFKCVAWERQAEIIHEFGKVGGKVYVSGSPKVESWNDKNSNEARSQLVLTVRDFEFLSKRETDDRPSEGDGWDGSVQD